MEQLAKNKATICVVNYKTLQLTRLCLRSIRKFTDYPYEVIVVDNNSQDESTDYLKSLDWIKLIERTDPANDSSGGYAHGAALDLALQNCQTEFFVSLHSDTFIKKQNWLGDLIGYFDNDETIACVGAGKIELTPTWRQMLKRATDFRTFKRKLLGQPDEVGKHRYYNRTMCGLYRTDILKKENLSFLMARDKGLTVGKKLYFELADNGYKTVELPKKLMSSYVVHLTHATQVINADEFNLKSRTKKKVSRWVNKMLNNRIVREILTDDSLDK